MASACGETAVHPHVRHLSAAEAAELDRQLFSDYRYSVDQLMELAGLSVAVAVARHFPQGARVLVVCGPGNNGGDGLVAARHLRLFGYRPSLLYPRRPDSPLYQALLHQCLGFDIPALEEHPTDEAVNRDYDLLLDALFGFSYKPPVRDYLRPALDLLVHTKLPVCSVDVPSGWDVDEGPVDAAHVRPALLVSLSAPKLCSRQHVLQQASPRTLHVLGGRFLPPSLAAKFDLALPDYPQQELILRLH